MQLAVLNKYVNKSINKYINNTKQMYKQTKTLYNEQGACLSQQMAQEVNLKQVWGFNSIQRCGNKDVKQMWGIDLIQRCDFKPLWAIAALNRPEDIGLRITIIVRK